MVTKDKFVYDIRVTANLDFLPSVSHLVNSLNKTMHDFGFTEDLLVMSNGMLGTVTTDREMTDAEKGLIIDLLQQELSKDELLKKFKVKELKLGLPDRSPGF